MPIKRNWEDLSLYLEDVEVGDEFITPSVTVTEAHLVNWGGVTQDMEELHLSEAFAQKTVWKGRIAYGLLGLALGEGLLTRLGLWARSAIGYLGLSQQFLAPIRIGDTIYMKVKVVEKKLSQTKPDRGTLKIAKSIFNQRGEEVQRGEATYMLKGSRPKEGIA